MFNATLRLLQPRAGHRAGTDAVLLSAALPPSCEAIADLGAASGVVGLRAAQLNPAARVVLIERDPALAGLARQNIALNALDGRVDVQGADVFELGRAAGLRESFDCVLSNPPFFEPGKVRVSGNENRARAHVLDGALDDWLRNAVTILAPKGLLVVVHRADAIETLLAAIARRLGGICIRFVHPSAEAPAIRVLISGIKGSRAPVTILPPLILHGADGAFTPEAAALHAGATRLDMVVSPDAAKAKARRRADASTRPDLF